MVNNRTLQDFLKGVAIGGMFVTLAEMTIEAFKLSWRIITLPEYETTKDETTEDETSEDEPEIFNCDKCHSVFINGNGGDYERVLLCVTCVEKFLDDQLKK